ncbi:hypothetical protein J6590_086251 [Homalodisca vitripennis]|nr:hypothetical protein J6590_086251 [Homalodisca vitripennis]
MWKHWRDYGREEGEEPFPRDTYDVEENLLFENKYTNYVEIPQVFYGFEYNRTKSWETGYMFCLHFTVPAACVDCMVAVNCGSHGSQEKYGILVKSVPLTPQDKSFSHRIPWSDRLNALEKSHTIPKVNNTEEPDDGRGSGEEEEEVHKQSSQHYTKTKDQEFVEYLADGKKIGEEMRYEAENVEGDREGDPSLLAQEWDSLSTRLKKMRRTKLHQLQRDGVAGMTPLDRKDALTKKPLDFDQEEETRKVETSKWLEHHFGSESRSSKDSIGDDDDLPATGTSTSFINVTMKSTKNKTRIPEVDHSTPKSFNVGNSSSRVFVSSPEAETLPPTTYFQGISEWKNSKEYQPERPARTSFSSPRVVKDGVQVLPTGPNHTFSPSKSSPSPPYPSSSLGSKNFRGSQGSNLNGRNSSGPESSSPFQSITEKHLYNRYYRHEQPSPSGDRNSSPLYRPERSSPFERSASPFHTKVVNGKTSSEEEPPRISSPRNHRHFNGHDEVCRKKIVR